METKTENARLRAFAEAARPACEYLNLHGLGDWKQARAALALLDSASDTGWRDRTPTLAEHEIHRGPWLYVLESDETLHLTWSRDYRGPSRWRPLTASGDPAPWPVVEE